MASTPSIDLDHIASRLGFPVEQVGRTLDLLDQGNTVAFVTRYRKDQTGGLDEEQIRHVQREATQSRQLAERKQSIVKVIDAQGKLTNSLRKKIESARTAKQLEDLYLPYKHNKQTHAMLARQRGLGPLADEVLSTLKCDVTARATAFIALEQDLPTAADVLAGVKYLIAENFSERFDVRAKLRDILFHTGYLVSSRIAAVDETVSAATETDTEASVAATIAENPSHEAPTSSVTTDKEEVAASVANPKISVRQRKRSKLESSLRDYFEFREALGKIRPHRVLAINRGERAKILRVKIEGDNDALLKTATELLVPTDHVSGDFLRECVRGALNRLIVPSLERELRRELSDTAEAHAVSVFARNLRKLFLQRPVNGRRVLAVDPGFKSGCKLVALDEFGRVLEHANIFLIGGEEKLRQARTSLIDLVNRHRLSVIAIGNGAACREAELMVADAIGNELRGQGVEYVIVNEAGASVYSTSLVGREELPDFDAIYRSAVSIGRRLLDPLSELVKINPANIGVGMYQHDVKAKHLRESLDAVVESCVNFVGVDVNTASPALLSYVSGLNQLTARRLYEYRLEHGSFRTREQFREVPGIGAATFVQAAGFLKITDGDNPLDATWIHPESYNIAERVLERLGSSLDDLSGVVSHPPEGASSRTAPADGTAAATLPLAQRVSAIDLAAMAAELGIGELSLRDILESLVRPGRDPRDDLPAPTFRSGIMKLDDIEPGMELVGTVLNVVDFGAFVDIGISDSSLVHISRLADRYIRDPHEVVSIGDVLPVWVLKVDRERRRVSLTAIPPTKSESKSSSSTQPAKSQPAKGMRSQRTSSPQPKAGPRPPKFRQMANRENAAKPTAQPITPRMVEGKEPMRTFSDLLQYYEVKKHDDSSPSPEE